MRTKAAAVDNSPALSVPELFWLNVTTTHAVVTFAGTQLRRMRSKQILECVSAQLRSSTAWEQIFTSHFHKRAEEKMREAVRSKIILKRIAGLALLAGTIGSAPG